MRTFVCKISVILGSITALDSVHRPIAAQGAISAIWIRFGLSHAHINEFEWMNGQFLAFGLGRSVGQIDDSVRS